MTYFPFKEGDLCRYTSENHTNNAEIIKYGIVTHIKIRGTSPREINRLSEVWATWAYSKEEALKNYRIVEGDKDLTRRGTTWIEAFKVSLIKEVPKKMTLMSFLNKDLEKAT